MAREITIGISSDAAHLGEAATQRDLDQYAASLRARVEAELDVRATVRQRDGVEAPESTDPEVQDWLEALTETDHLALIGDRDETIDTAADILAYNVHENSANGIAYNDRGNGSAGSGWIKEGTDGLESDAVTEVSREEDEQAWRLAYQAHSDLRIHAPRRVWVGQEGDGSNPHQTIYSI